jgi:hypothetical protein
MKARRLSRRLLLGIVALVAQAGAVTAQDAPAVLRTEPPNLAIDVAAATRRIAVTFDRDMDPGAEAVVDRGPTVPTLTATAWQDARTFVLEVELVPDRVYALELSGRGTRGLRSAAGDRLPPFAWRFATRGEEVAAEVREDVARCLFAALRERYAYHDRLGIDWNDLAWRARPGIVAAPQMAGLALRIAEVLATAQDPHVAVSWRDATLATFARDVRTNFDIRPIKELLPGLTPIGGIGMQARTADGIGYLLVGSFAAAAEQDFERCLAALRTLRDCKALIVDVRPNAGGDERLAHRLAAFFVDGLEVYGACRVRDPRAEGGFAPAQQRSIRGNSGPDVYTGRVAVLMGPVNMAACEAFLLMMRQARDATLLGETSYGSSGQPQQIALAPGLAVLLPCWQELRPDGTCFEGDGIAPAIEVRTPPQELGRTDPVLAEALAHLRTAR